MAKHPKRPRDANQLAKLIVDVLTQSVPNPDYESVSGGDAGKDPAAVDLGRRGGIKGGRARADSLTPEKRSEIARKAAAKRWSK